MVPTTLELLAISAGLEFLEALGLTGTVFSDCQGLVKNLRHLHVPPADPRWPGYHLIRACVRHLTHPRRKLQWIRCHPNARGRPALGGTNLIGEYISRTSMRGPPQLRPLSPVYPFKSRSPSPISASPRVPLARKTGTGPRRVTPLSSAPSAAR